MYSDWLILFLRCVNVIMLHSAHTELSSGEGFCCGGTQAIIHWQIRQHVRVCLTGFYGANCIFEAEVFVDSYNKENDMRFATVYYHLLLWTDCFALLYKQVYSDVEPAAWSTLLLEPYVKEQCSSPPQKAGIHLTHKIIHVITFLSSLCSSIVITTTTFKHIIWQTWSGHI